jgi:hypothetical protein
MHLQVLKPNCAKSFVTRGGIEMREKQVVAPKVAVTVPADGKWHEYADKKRGYDQTAPAVRNRWTGAQKEVD